MEMSSIERVGPESSQPAFRCSVTFVTLWVRKKNTAVRRFPSLAARHLDDQMFSLGATLCYSPTILELHDRPLGD